MRNLGVASAFTLLGLACTGAVESPAVTPGKPPPSMPNPDGREPMRPPPSPPAAVDAGGMPPSAPPPEVESFPPLTCDGKTPATPGPRRLWRLTSAQYRHTISIFLGGRQTVGNAGLVPKWLIAPFEGSGSSERYSNQSGGHAMNDFELRRAVATAHEIATRFVASQRTAPTSCLGPSSTMAHGTCLRSLIEQRGPLLFQRPLQADEVERYAKIAENATASLGADDATALAFEALLVAPQFLYRSEVGSGSSPTGAVVRLNPYETAAAISYTLVDWPPDNTLWKAAMANELQTPEQIAPHVVRLLGTLTNVPTLERFVSEYFRYGKVLDVFKDVKGHDPSFLLKDTESFVKEVIKTNGRSKFVETLLTADWGYVNRFTALNWGTPSTSYTPVRATYPAGQRAGLLTHPSFLAGFSEMDHTQPVQRGRFISESLLCRAIPELPIGQVPDLPDLGAMATMRDRLKIHSQRPDCAACHKLMDPLGLPFERFDDIGRWRETEAGKPVDASGVLSGAGAEDGPVPSPLELAAKLARSPVVEACVMRHAFRYWMGRHETEGDGCTINQMVSAYQKGGGDYVAMLQALLTSNVFLYRTTN